MIAHRRTLSIVAGVAACFCVAMSVSLWVRNDVGPHEDPLQTEALAAMNEQLKKTPGDAELRQRIRDADLVLRTQFFQRQRAVQWGAWLLLAGAVVAVGAVKLAQPSPRDNAQPTPPAAQAAWRNQTRARYAVMVMGAMMLVGVAALVVTVDGRTPWPAPVAEDDARPDPFDREAAADPQQVLANWPAFRGPGGLGVAPNRHPPMQWDVPAKSNVRWTVPIDSPGHSSPIVWGDRIFVTAATKQRRVVLCFALEDGRLLWEFPVNIPRPTGQEPPEVMEDTGYAAPTPATDGRRVYAIFANGDLVAIDFDGNEVWHKAYGTPSDMYGHSNSLICRGNRLFVQFDQYDEQRPDTLTCFDGPTGEATWTARRNVEGSWASLCVGVAAKREQLITIASPWAIAYDPAGGAVWWQSEGFEGDVATSPTLAGDLVILTAPAHQIVAVRGDANGTVTDEHIAWRSDEAVPDVTSPVADEQHLYTVTTLGEVVARRLSDGQVVWRKRLGGTFRASPILAAGRLFLFNDDGRGYVLDPADGAEVGGGPVGAPVAATPAFVRKLIIVRTERGLICIGADGP